MDAYMLHLLGMAVEACQAHDPTLNFQVHFESDNLKREWDFMAGGINVMEEVYIQGTGPTLADALAALLTDLSVEVPERPSAEKVGRVDRDLARELGTDRARWLSEAIRDLYAREPLTALALLEGSS